MTGARRMGLILAGLLLLPALGTSAEQAKKSADKRPAPLAKNMGASPSGSGPLAPLNNDYRLGVNDVLDVHVWKEPELSRVVSVRPDGKISLPLVGEVEAVGRTALELRETMAERLKTFVSEPEITVIVQQINSQRYFVVGEVQNPGVYPLTVPITVMQALAMAGGFREFADTSDITIVRRAEDNRTVHLPFSYKDWLKNKKQLEHLMLRNGDVIVVP